MRFPSIVEHCSFDYMKRNATKSAPLGGVFWDGGAETFIHKGTNGRWRDVLSAEECVAYDARSRAEFGEACAAWLADKKADPYRRYYLYLISHLDWGWPSETERFPFKRTPKKKRLITLLSS
jgi:hypothetical protein